MYYQLSFGVATVLGIYSAFTEYVRYRKLKEKAKESEKHKRSNCIVMFAHGLMSGWPPYEERFLCGVGKLDLLFEPVIYFIDVTEQTLDLAVMWLSVEKYITALANAKKRGVKIRVITQFEKSSTVFKRLKKMGVSLTLFVPTEDFCQKLFHYKYMVRDIGTSNQCASIGSMNYTVTGPTDNYENIVFTQVPCVVEGVHKNFEDCLKAIAEDNQNLYKKSILQNTNIL